MRAALIAVTLLALTGCQKGAEHDKSAHGEIRRAYFVECMKLLPAGPQSTRYNDWDDVVDACSTSAWYMANDVCSEGCPKALPRVELP